ncbi:MAG: proton-dependent oligopeptide transporter POT family [Elusimicrobia bacterium]|nr:MAG: proton-dependent oligopeptide transporter POT family [Elusimicrobiota bacterium]KAF0157480.1 MAG: proton-dependent oligopeptide transporter POT family [Elusimicrobiota bacterium]
MSIHKNHPKGLFLLFFVEMWERFSYYGMRALLVLYMIKALDFSTEKAGQVYGWYTGLVYLTPLLGGYIADRYMGQRKAIVVGGTLMALGHFAMAFPPIPFFFGAMILLILGNGFFKPNISTVVGALYEQNDPRRDAGFTIFYMGINLGAMFSPLVCSTLGEKVGWHWGFGAAGVGMVIGLAMYIWGNKALLGDKCMKPAAPKTDYWVPITLVAAMTGFLILSAMQISGIDIKGMVPGWLYSTAALLVAIGLVYAYAAKPEKSTLTHVEKQRLSVIFIMVFFTIFFWSAFEQAGSSLTLFADRETDRWINIFGWRWEMPAGYFQSLNPLFIVLLAPFFSNMWINLAEKDREPSSPIKFAMGLGLLAIGFVVMIAAAAAYQQSGPVSMLWLVGAYFFHTLGELCLSPVGLSLVTKLAPVQFGSLMMGVWFLSSVAAGFVGGFFAGNYDTINHVHFFMIPTATALGAAVLLVLITPKLRKWMHGVH